MAVLGQAGGVRRVFVDTEFTDLPWTGRSRLFWVGLADDQGGRCSAVLADTDLRECSEFVRARVLPLVPEDEPRLRRADLAALVVDFCGQVDEFWAWQPSRDDLVALGVDAMNVDEMWRRYRDWDYQLLRSLVGPVAAGWPQRCRDLHALARTAGIVPPANPNPHHPGDDAAWGLLVYQQAIAVVDPAAGCRHRADARRAPAAGRHGRGHRRGPGHLRNPH